MKESILSIARFMKEGGPWMWPILFTGLGSIAIWVERFYAIRIRYHVNADNLMGDVRKALVVGDFNLAVQACQKHAKSALAFVLMSGIKKGSSASKEELENAIDEAAMEIGPQMQKRLSYLPMISQISTLLGLLGTIQGMIGAFSGLTAADPSQRSTMLARAISEALNCTAFGLIVAIPNLVVFSYFQSSVARIVNGIELYSAKLINLIFELKGPVKKEN